MYKIINHYAPEYLHDLLPQTVAERNPYRVRNNLLYSIFKCNTESYKNSYFPLTISDWNALPDDVKKAESIPSFKNLLYRMAEFKIVTPPKWFSYGARHLNIIHAQLRNNCSPLANDLVSNHIQIIPTCRQCVLNRPEDAKHFFLDCPKYTNIRHKMIAAFSNSDIPCNINTILNGSINHNYKQNQVVIDSIHEYISASKRFSA